MRLRVIDFGYVSPLRSQAVYHGLALAMEAGADPVLSLVNPTDPYVCVGVHQEIAREVDEDYCASLRLPIIRRQVGGGAVYLDRQQMFFHFIYPREKAPQYAANLYPLFCEPAVRTYREMGIAAEYRPINDIQVARRKIGGTGAASIGAATAMVGSFMFDFDTAAMARCLKVPSEKFRDKLKATLDDYMTTMRRELPTVPSREDVQARFLRHCEAVLDVTAVPDRATAAEERMIAEQETALSEPEWTNRQGRKFVELGVKISAGTHLTESAHKAQGGLIRAHLLARDGVVADLMLSGDYTVLPVDGADRVAAALIGVELDADALNRAAAVAMQGLDIPGVAPGDIAAVVMAAVQPAD